MTTSLLSDAFRHHVWATEVILDTCAGLSDEQLNAPAPGTYGPIIETLRHIVQADSFYLRIFTDGRVPELEQDAKLSVAELRTVFAAYGPAYDELLATNPDPDAWVIEGGEYGEFHSMTGLRLAQVVHHGSDHRSQVCTALTSRGVTPPEIDLWAYGEAVGRTREVEGASSERAGS